MLTMSGNDQARPEPVCELSQKELERDSQEMYDSSNMDAILMAGSIRIWYKD